MKKHIIIVDLLIKNGADVNLGKHNKTITPLHMAARNDDLKIIKLLLENGAHVDKINIINRTYLEIYLNKEKLNIF